MSTSAAELNVADASRLAQKMRLSGVHCAGLKALMVTGGDVTGDLGWKMRPIDIAWGIEENQLRVVVPVSLHVFRPKDQGGEHVAELGVLLRLDYELLENGEAESALDSFAGISGWMHAWPYIRAEIQHLSTKLELPPLVLPPVVSGHVKQFVGAVGRLGPGVEKPRRASGARPPRKPRRARKGG